MDSIVTTLNAVFFAFGIVFSYWWIWAPWILIVLYLEALKSYNQKVYKAALTWITYDFKLPTDAHKSLKAMEQIFAGLHVVGQGAPAKNLWEKFKKWRDEVFGGKMPDWFSVEIVGAGGEIHFYIRIVEKYKQLAEAQIYAQYPDAELTPLVDYMVKFPASVSLAEANINAVELTFIKDNIFPIKTYPEFDEESAGKDDVRRIDPLAPIIETLGEMTFSEFFGIQILARSTGDAWIKAGQPAMDKLMGKEEKKQKIAAAPVFEFIEGTLGSIIGSEAAVPKEEKKKEDKPFNQLNPGVQETIKTIERATAKLAFEAGIRLLYLAPLNVYTDGRMASVAAAFKQFSTQALNGFKPGMSTQSKKPAQAIKNKGILYGAYRSRAFPKKPIILNTEEITTLFHVPDVGVKTPSLSRIEAKKGEAPAGLPIV